LDDFRAKLNDEVAGIMITNPSTLGIFESNICTISEEIHKAGGLLYMDGANLNALLGITHPGKIGVDALHINLHKTFSTPHGAVVQEQVRRCFRKTCSLFANSAN